VAVLSDLPPLGDLRQGLSTDVLQIWMYLKDDELAQIPPLPHIKYTKWHEGGIDMIAKNGGKAVGIQQLMAHYGISREETIAFGDAENDIDMLRNVGIAVAMGNACDAVKAEADFITTDIDDGGIFNALKHFDLI
jgi:hydroxymethylpyrimidine pyrophosphatase-like HAD family hydrolase